MLARLEEEKINNIANKKEEILWMLLRYKKTKINYWRRRRNSSLQENAK